MDIYTESSGIDTSPDMNSSSDRADDPSPERLSMLKPRTLTYDESDDMPALTRSNEHFHRNVNNNSINNNNNNNNSSDDDAKKLLDDDEEPAMLHRNRNSGIIRPMLRPSSLVHSSKLNLESPPYRKVRALRLFDTPATPKTIIKKSASSEFLQPSTACKLNTSQRTTVFGADTVPATPNVHDRPKAVPVHNKMLDSFTANINPFSPTSNFLQNKKRSRGEEHITQNNVSQMRSSASFESLVKKSNLSIHSVGDDNIDDSIVEEERQAPKRLALQDSNIPRYEKEFLELSLIGVGEFGVAYQCLNRLDGCIYAIKKSIKPVAGSVFEKTALNEVYAHAVLGKHDNVVRYYSAWAENRHMLIQNEYCDGGSLQTLLQQRCLVESELRTLLMHIAGGLKYIHSNDLVHMDLKAGNIFLTKAPIRSQTFGSGISSSNEMHDDGFEDIYEELEMDVTYKIGDLGHVTSIKNPQVEEGDCRYLPNEILQEDYTHLAKADIFSLGITLYEAGGGGPLPKNGPEWHDLREGRVPDLPNISREFNDLIKLMTHPNPNVRPSSTAILENSILCPAEAKTKSQLAYELNLERKKNELLMRKFRETKKLLKSYEMSNTPRVKRALSSPIESDRKLRSFSRTKNSSSMSVRRAGFRDRNKNIT